jgi:hypothetical protein
VKTITITMTMFDVGLVVRWVNFCLVPNQARLISSLLAVSKLIALEI